MLILSLNFSNKYNKKKNDKWLQIRLDSHCDQRLYQFIFSSKYAPIDKIRNNSSCLSSEGVRFIFWTFLKSSKAFFYTLLTWTRWQQLTLLIFVIYMYLYKNSSNTNADAVNSFALITKLQSFINTTNTLVSCYKMFSYN